LPGYPLVRDIGRRILPRQKIGRRLLRDICRRQEGESGTTWPCSVGPASLLNIVAGKSTEAPVSGEAYFCQSRGCATVMVGTIRNHAIGKNNAIRKYLCIGAGPSVGLSIRSASTYSGEMFGADHRGSLLGV
jgi:hypothetical protein